MKHLDFLLWNTPAQQSSAAAAHARVHVCRRIQLCWSHSWTGDHVCPGWWSQLNTAKRVFIRSSLQTKKSHLTANLMFVPPELAQRGRDGGNHHWFLVRNPIPPVRHLEILSKLTEMGTSHTPSVLQTQSKSSGLLVRTHLSHTVQQLSNVFTPVSNLTAHFKTDPFIYLITAPVLALIFALF